ncbi:centrosomal protein of 85 kDa-like isoform X2 [Cololabis saira]|uniref:centrosomal protein of 85 kDa-like isoform X2 n=1 Tax=Cololabis saira TaxID=129043 RepID=UPI002AD461DA|nr:centrosomal protein of 85 kDa-like isoform X2 [Cololabis saira]
MWFKDGPGPGPGPGPGSGPKPGPGPGPGPQTSSSSGSRVWVPGPGSTWTGTVPGPGSKRSDRRRLSSVSDSGDTGIGTCCSDSNEDDSGSTSTPLSFRPLPSLRFSPDDDGVPGVPVVPVLPTPSSSPGTRLRTPSSAPWSRSCPRVPAWSPAPPDLQDLRDLRDLNPQPIRRSSSFTRLSSGPDRNPARTSRYQPRAGATGSLDRGLLPGFRKRGGSDLDLYLDLYLDLTPSGTRTSCFLQRSPGSSPGFWSTGGEPDLRPSSAHSSPVRQTGLDWTYSPLSEGRPPLAPGGPGSGPGWSRPVQRSDRTSPIQPAVRTQMWLTEQMEYQPRPDQGGPAGPPGPPGPGGTRTDGWEVSDPSPWQQDAAHHQASMSLPVSALVKVKEGLLRQRELEINRQKQQILQLQARIRENELRTQQVLQTHRDLDLDPLRTQQVLQTHLDLDLDPLRTQQVLQTHRDLDLDPLRTQQVLQTHLDLDPLRTQQVLQTHRDLDLDPLRTQQVLQTHRDLDLDPLRTGSGELSRRLTTAELEVLQLNKFFKQVNQKYSEDVRKLEDKIKTRDRYISSLKKKFQRESDQNREKQQRIETLEKYLSQVPTLDQVDVQNKQEQTCLRVSDLQRRVSRLQRRLDDGRNLMEQKDKMIQVQNEREDELLSSVLSLKGKVQQCLDDGVRLPMQDLKRLEVENLDLLQQQDQSSRMFRIQRDEIERLTSRLKAASSKLQKKKSSCQSEKEVPWSRTVQEGDEGEGERVKVRTSELDQLLKEMFLILLDLQGLCSILAQRAEGKQPSISLLLGLNPEDCDRSLQDQELSFKLLEVGRLRRDIDELRRNLDLVLV